MVLTNANIDVRYCRTMEIVSVSKVGYPREVHVTQNVKRAIRHATRRASSSYVLPLPRYQPPGLLRVSDYLANPSQLTGQATRKLEGQPSRCCYEAVLNGESSTS